LKDTIDYMENPFKTDNGEWVTSYECDARTADKEFLLSKQKYAAITGRNQGKRDIIAYHVRQSFKPGEITPEEANRIGYELAMRFTKGKYAFIVCTHTDKAHIHSHIIWNSTSLDCTRKFRNFYFSAIALRRLSDLICLENGLSIIENPGLSKGKDYGRYMFGVNRPPTFHSRLRATIDSVLENEPATFDEFLDMMRSAGCVVMAGGKHLKFLAPPEEGLPNQTKPTRCDTLKGDYTVAAIKERIAGRRVLSSRGRATVSDGDRITVSDDDDAIVPDATRRIQDAAHHAAHLIPSTPRHPSLLIDIQTKIQEGKGAGYERWAKLHNLKQMAQTLIYLQEQGLDDYDVLNEKASAASARFNELTERIKELDAGLDANSALQKQIVTYSKTRKTYVEYRKAGYSKQFKALHEADIILHQAAKKYFDNLGYGRKKKLPTVASLRAEYATMLDEKKPAYREYRQAKTDMKTLLTARSNVQRLLNISEGSGHERKEPML